jgi:hypothetical protein
MKKLTGLNSFGACLILVIALMLFSGPAQAYVYDHFTSPGIDASLWVDRGTNYGLFSQPGDSYLYFSDSIGGQSDRLRSYDPVSGAFAVAMQYSNFQAGNNQPAGQGKGSTVALRLGYGNNYVDMMEFKNISGQGVQAQSYIGATGTPLNYVYNNFNSAWFGIVYNGVIGPGGQIEFWYDSGAGWTKLASCAQDFSQAPYFSIVGGDLYGQSLSFRVDQVQVFPTPLPAGVLLLGSGLLGLVGWRRFRKD